ncbi:MAG: LacI family DNA-binding transcriptional regulator [Rhodobacteraceae bacterium]|nr:LacI family DNA-binding transcriptional regulator [Paracoccaceae bacterium]
MPRRATMQDLARRAGVSVSTVDRILNGRAEVRPATAARVLAAAEDLAFYALPALRDRLTARRGTAVRLGFLLQQSHRDFYRQIADGLRAAATASPDPVEVEVEHMEDLSPEAVAGNILRLGPRVQALAVVSAEHPLVTKAIETLAAQGVPTYGLISDLTAACGVGFFGLDNWRVGRTAGWAVAGLCRRAGQVGILMGNHRYRCQEMNEAGFRSYCREHGTHLTLLEPQQTFENRAIARDVTARLLRRDPGIVALFVCGGGMAGVLEVLEEVDPGRSICVVGLDLPEHTRMGLIAGRLSVVIAHPLDRLLAVAIAEMRADVAQGRATPARRVLPFDILTPENV